MTASTPPRVCRLIEEKSFNKLSDFVRTGILKKEFKFQAFTPEELRALFEACGLRVVRIIGKPVLAQCIPREIRDDTIEKNFGRLLRLESKLCGAPSLVGTGGHLEIVGAKPE